MKPPPGMNHQALLVRISRKDSFFALNSLRSPATCAEGWQCPLMINERTRPFETFTTCFNVSFSRRNVWLRIATAPFLSCQSGSTIANKQNHACLPFVQSDDCWESGMNKIRKDICRYWQGRVWSKQLPERSQCIRCLSSISPWFLPSIHPA